MAANRDFDEHLDAALTPLIDRIAQRDEQALVQLYDATLGNVYGLALRITQRVDIAEEVVGDVYLQAWRQADQYRQTRGRVLAWLLTIARSRALDRLRRRDRLLVDAESEHLQNAADEGDMLDPIELAMSVERGSHVQRALSELSQIQQHLLTLAFFRGFTHQEIAQHTGVPLGTVKTHIRRALNALRTTLSAAGVTL